MNDIPIKINRDFTSTFRLNKNEKAMENELRTSNVDISEMYRNVLKSTYCQMLNVDNNWDGGNNG